MHPSPSVIIFTTLSGLGFGLLIFLGLGEPVVTAWTAFWFFVIAYALSVGSLTCPNNKQTSATANRANKASPRKKKMATS